MNDRKLMLEYLEDRLVPATNYWDPPTGTSPAYWSAGTNWSAGHYPQASLGDTAINFGRDGAEVAGHDFNQDCEVSGLTTTDGLPMFFSHTATSGTYTHTIQIDGGVSLHLYSTGADHDFKDPGHFDVVGHLYVDSSAWWDGAELHGDGTVYFTAGDSLIGFGTTSWGTNAVSINGTSSTTVTLRETAADLHITGFEPYWSIGDHGILKFGEEANMVQTSRTVYFDSADGYIDNYGGVERGNNDVGVWTWVGMPIRNEDDGMVYIPSGGCLAITQGAAGGDLTNGRDIHQVGLDSKILIENSGQLDCSANGVDMYDGFLEVTPGMNTAYSLTVGTGSSNNLYVSGGDVEVDHSSANSPQYFRIDGNVVFTGSGEWQASYFGNGAVDRLYVTGLLSITDGSCAVIKVENPFAQETVVICEAGSFDTTNWASITLPSGWTDLGVVSGSPNDYYEVKTS